MVVLINPNLVVQSNDPFTTGIVYMPIGLAYIASSLREAGFEIKVIDAFASKPDQIRHQGNFLVFGLTNDEVLQEISPDCRIVIIYAINLTNHISTLGIIQAVKHKYRDVHTIVVENTQAVTAYSLNCVADDFYNAGADYLLTGEGEYRAVRLVQALTGEEKGDLRKIDGLGSREFYNAPENHITDLDKLPFPAWDMFPLKNYWDLHFAHGPLTTKRYLPLLTSRGCPYQCRFCVIPKTSNKKWRMRSAKNVVDEIQYFVNAYNVREFHIEDVDPTILDRRIRDICLEIINRNLNIIWKIVSGTKIETIRNEETVDLMARAGCRYVSISPESGSPRVLKLMNKPFNLAHAEHLAAYMSRAGIRLQVCFVLGFPGETENDLQMTRDLVRRLTQKGIDEIALFIVTPVPGSSIYESFHGYESLSELNFSPVWREDYVRLNRFRLKLYRNFLLWKLLYHPLKFFRQMFNFLLRRFETKMEMTPYRAMVFKWRDLKGGIL
jgi:radical SAM superfamily enzyme YgiQ (UPF0313 family)